MITFVQNTFDVFRFIVAWAVGDQMIFCTLNVFCFSIGKAFCMAIVLAINASWNFTFCMWWFKFYCVFEQMSDFIDIPIIISWL